MDNDFKRALLVVLGLFLFISFAIGREEEVNEGNGPDVAAFNLPALE